MKIENLKIRYLIFGWLGFSLALLAGLHFFVDGEQLWPLRLTTMNGVITLVLAPLAALSAGMGFLQWRVQRDRESGYEDPQASAGEIAMQKGLERVGAESTDATAGDDAAQPKQASDDSLIIFQTSKQKTTLKIEDGVIACYLDDIRPGRGGLQWKLNRQAIKEITRNPERHITMQPYKPDTGLLSIGNRRNWLYSKRLFAGTEDLQQRVEELLNKA